MAGQSKPMLGKRALIVEDESRVAVALQALLADMGCEIAGTATRLDDALSKAAALQFDVALLDVHLGGDLSFPVADLIAARGLALVFATGDGSVLLPEALRDRPLLQKPYRMRDVEGALRAVLSPSA